LQLNSAGYAIGIAGRNPIRSIVRSRIADVVGSVSHP